MVSKVHSERLPQQWSNFGFIVDVREERERTLTEPPWSDTRFIFKAKLSLLTDSDRTRKRTAGQPTLHNKRAHDDPNDDQSSCPYRVSPGTQDNRNGTITVISLGVSWT